MTIELFLPNEEATVQFSHVVADLLPLKGMVYLTGELGAGKTCFIRGILQSLGYDGRVKSPTYTLFEEYDVAGRLLYHLDLYRLRAPNEFYDLGLRDHFDRGLFLVEWPEKADSHLPPFDIHFHFDLKDDGRRVTIEVQGELGQEFVTAVAEKLRN